MSSPYRYPLWGLRRRGPLPHPMHCFEAYDGPDHRPALGARPEACRGEGCCLAYGGATRPKESEAECGHRATVRVSC